MQYCLFNGNGESVIIKANTIYNAVEYAKELFDNSQFVSALIEDSAKVLIEEGIKLYIKN